MPTDVFELVRRDLESIREVQKVDIADINREDKWVLFKIQIKVPQDSMVEVTLRKGGGLSEVFRKLPVRSAEDKIEEKVEEYAHIDGIDLPKRVKEYVPRNLTNSGSPITGYDSDSIYLALIIQEPSFVPGFKTASTSPLLQKMESIKRAFQPKVQRWKKLLTPAQKRLAGRAADQIKNEGFASNLFKIFDKIEVKEDRITYSVPLNFEQWLHLGQQSEEVQVIYTTWIQEILQDLAS